MTGIIVSSPRNSRYPAKLLRKDVRIAQPYGLTETFGVITFVIPGTPYSSCGIIQPSYDVKLVNLDTGETIVEPHVTGELWVKGPSCREYCNNPEATKIAFTDDGYYKTGDLLYRDQDNFYYFVDRIKSLMKYQGNRVAPAHIEAVILTHPSVHAVAVCGVSHPVDGQRATACVVTKAGCHVSGQEIKDLVASKLSKKKHLHGGVVFVDEIPKTSSEKVARAKVLELIYNVQRTKAIKEQ